MSYDVLVVGSLHMDIMVFAPDQPRLGETLAGDSWNLKPGGKGGNQAVEASAAGARTAIIGVVGDDDFGRALLQNLRSRGVETSHVEIHKGAHSGISVALVHPAGDYSAVIVSAANLLLDASSIDDSHPALRGAACLLLQNEVPDAVNVAASRAAQANGVRTILNAAPARRLPEALSGNIDILIVNAIEAEALCGFAVDALSAASRAAVSLLDKANTVVVTAGPAGVAVATRSGLRSEIAGHRVDVVSTHGAGDCFIGSLAARLAGGMEIEEAVRYANAAAALRVASPAGFDHARHRESILAMCHAGAASA
jgi:ribokinase